MSHLNKLLRKLASPEPQEVEEVEETSGVDYTYVEKLATAVDYLIENNIILVKSAESDMSARMAPAQESSEAEKAVDAKASEKMKNILMSKIKAVKKLNETPSERKADSKKSKGSDKEEDKKEMKDEASEEEEKSASFTDAVGRLKEHLVSKVASAEEAYDGGLIDSIISRLSEDTYEEIAEEEEPEVLDASTVEASLEAEEAKEASEGVATLASMLEDAESGRADDADTSTPVGMKTAASQDDSLSLLLKGSLLKRIGQTEVN